MDDERNEKKQPNQEQYKDAFDEWLNARRDGQNLEEEDAQQPETELMGEQERETTTDSQQPEPEQPHENSFEQPVDAGFYPPPSYDQATTPNWQYNAEGMQPQKEVHNKAHKSKAPKILAIIAIIMASVLVGVLLAIYVIYPALGNQSTQGGIPGTTQTPQESVQPSQGQEQQEQGELPDLGGEAPNIQDSYNPVPDIAEQVQNSVVGVLAQKTQYISGQEPQQTSVSRGTGFIVSEDGYIVTNNHVVASGTTYVVTMQDGTQYDAAYIGSDANLDVAVLKIEATGLQPVAIGSSADSRVGELVVTIGNPAGSGENLVGTVTVGYISALDRELLFNGERQKFIQTDAAINPGNSGGPLVNSKGEVIGIVTLKSLISSVTSSGQQITTEGIGFAIPIDTAMDAVEEIIQTGTVERPGIGVYAGYISEENAALWNVPTGVMIQDFMVGSTAMEAGLQVQDIITKVDGEEITSLEGFTNTIQQKEVGDTITLTVWRASQEREISVTVGNMNNMR